MIRPLPTAALFLALLLALPAGAQPPEPVPAPQANGNGNGKAAGDALLALEEAELRERMVTALAIAESVRMRGRTILVAMSEIARVRRSIEKLNPYSERRRELEDRLALQERRRAELEDEVERMFDEYLRLVATVATDLWPRLRRVSGRLGEDLARRQLGQLSELYPVMRGHVEEYNRTGAENVTQGMTERWRREIDDTWERRLDRLEEAPAPAAPAPSLPAPQPPQPKTRKEDI